jgi:hypothetical protein
MESERKFSLSISPKEPVTWSALQAGSLQRLQVDADPQGCGEPARRRAWLRRCGVRAAPATIANLQTRIRDRLASLDIS